MSFIEALEESCDYILRNRYPTPLPNIRSKSINIDKRNLHAILRDIVCSQGVCLDGMLELPGSNRHFTADMFWDLLKYLFTINQTLQLGVGSKITDKGGVALTTQGVTASFLYRTPLVGKEKNNKDSKLLTSIRCLHLRNNSDNSDDGECGYFISLPGSVDHQNENDENV